MLTDDEIDDIIDQENVLIEATIDDGNGPSWQSLAKIRQFARRIEAATRETMKADQWWDYHDGEHGIVDLGEYLDNVVADSDWPRERHIGQQYRFSAAAMLPDEYYEVAADGEEDVKFVPSTKAKWEAQQSKRSTT